MWTGGAAAAALGALSERISALKFVKSQLIASKELFADSQNEVTNTKEAISDLVEQANRIIDQILNSAVGSAQDRQRAVGRIIELIRSENLHLVAQAAARVSGEVPFESDKPQMLDEQLRWFRQQPSEGPLVLPTSLMSGGAEDGPEGPPAVPEPSNIELPPQAVDPTSIEGSKGPTVAPPNALMVL